MRHFLRLALAVIPLATGVQSLAAEGLLEKPPCCAGAIRAWQGCAWIAVLLTVVAAGGSVARTAGLRTHRTIAAARGHYCGLSRSGGYGWKATRQGRVPTRAATPVSTVMPDSRALDAAG
jgi:hypothetical protein